MADKPVKTVRKRAPETVRERSEQQNNAKPKRRIVRRTATGISLPFKITGRFIFKKIRPLGFLLRPFKTRPMRFLGRLFNKIFLVDYFYNSWLELKQVSWPGRRETFQLTIAVFAFATIFGLLISVTDYGLDKIFKQVILK